MNLAKSFGWKLYIHQKQLRKHVQKITVSEYWNINELIYSIENHLPNIDNPVFFVSARLIDSLYLSACSDLTEKWCAKNMHFSSRKILIILILLVIQLIQVIFPP